MLTRTIGALISRQEVFDELIRILAVCQDPMFEVGGPICQKSARSILSKHHCEVLVNLQKKHFKSLQPLIDIGNHPQTKFQYFYACLNVSVILQ